MKVNSNIEDALDLPHLDEILKQAKLNEEEKLATSMNEEVIPEVADGYRMVLESNKKIEDAMIEDDSSFQKHDKEMNEIYQKAMTGYQDMSDLAFNIDPRHSGDIMSAAVQILKVALDSSNSKVERRIKSYKLQLDKRRLDQLEPAKEGVINQEGEFYLDRNELLKKIQESRKSNPSEGRSDSEDTVNSEKEGD